MEDEKLVGMTLDEIIHLSSRKRKSGPKSVHSGWSNRSKKSSQYGRSNHSYRSNRSNRSYKSYKSNQSYKSQNSFKNQSYKSGRCNNSHKSKQSFGYNNRGHVQGSGMRGRYAVLPSRYHPLVGRNQYRWHLERTHNQRLQMGLKRRSLMTAEQQCRAIFTRNGYLREQQRHRLRDINREGLDIDLELYEGNYRNGPPPLIDTALYPAQLHRLNDTTHYPAQLHRLNDTTHYPAQLHRLNDTTHYLARLPTLIDTASYPARPPPLIDTARYPAQLLPLIETAPGLSSRRPPDLIDTARVRRQSSGNLVKVMEPLNQDRGSPEEFVDMTVTMPQTVHRGANISSTSLHKRFGELKHQNPFTFTDSSAPQFLD